MSEVDGGWSITLPLVFVSFDSAEADKSSCSFGSGGKF